MDALDLLLLQIEWGADEALDEAPVDRLRLLPLSEFAPAAPAAPARPTIAVAVPRATPAERAVAAAAKAATLADLRSAIATFDGCGLRDTAANLVFAVGEPSTGLLLIGDPPGADEDRSGNAFTSPAGVLLDRMLASIGLGPSDLMRAPLIPWRPPGGRPPNPGEIAICLPFLHRLIVLSNPRRIILCGTLAARTLLPSSRRRSAPTWIPVPVPGLPSPVAAMPMPNLENVARTVAARREAWAALRQLRRTLDADIAEK